MMNRIVIVFFLLLIGFSVWAQIETVLWQTCLGTEDGENSTKTVEKSENGYFFGITLNKDGPGVTNYHGKADIWVVKTDFTGSIIWEKCFGGSEGDGSRKIINIDDTSCYLLNSSVSDDGDVLNGRAGDFWVVKINSSGDIIWENSYGGCITGEEVRDAILMPDNGLLMMGRISSTGGDITTYYGDMDIWMCRIDSIGNILWQKTIGNEGADNGLKIKLTSRNTILFVGSHELAGDMIDCPDIGYYIYIDVWIVEMDMDGSIINQWCYGGKYPDQGHDIIEVLDGYVIVGTTVSNDRDVSGLHGSPGGDFYDLWAFKIDLSGNLIWQRCLGGYSMDIPVYITETVDSGFITIGYTMSNDGDVTGNHTTEYNEVDIWVVKLSSDGQLLWEHCIGGLGRDRFWGIHNVLKLDDYHYVIGANSNYASDDVSCDLFPNDPQSHAWLFEIKDCNYYAPGVPWGLSGSDTLCSLADPTSSYSFISTLWASGYEWKFEPENAGTVIYNDTNAQITWNPQFEGTVNISARSYNDCGYSAWSEPLMTRVYTCMGVNDHEGMEAGRPGSMEVWPNPASGVLSVKCLGLSSGSSCSLSVFDIFGREVSLPRLGEGQGGGWDGSWQIDVSSLPPGIYIAVVKDGNTVLESAKFVVVR